MGDVPVAFSAEEKKQEKTSEHPKIFPPPSFYPESFKSAGTHSASDGEGILSREMLA
jgi:hypothetical protein